MTRNTYRILAAELGTVGRDVFDTGTPHAIAAFVAAVDVMMANLKADNGRFDRCRFIDALGLVDDVDEWDLLANLNR